MKVFSRRRSFSQTQLDPYMHSGSTRLLSVLLALLTPLVTTAAPAQDAGHPAPHQSIDTSSSPPAAAAPPPGASTTDYSRRRRFTPSTVPPEPKIDHESSKTLPIGRFQISTSVKISDLEPIKMEASYNQLIGLKSALTYALENNLPIKITRESWHYQRYTLLSNLFSALPLISFGGNLTETWSKILSTATARSFVFAPTLFLPVFQGGSQVYTLWAQYYRDKGWRQSFNTSVNDALLDVYRDYENLLLQHTLLKIRENSLEVSQAQLDLNTLLYKAGTGTQFSIMQSRTQLASDRQAMQQQQVNVRQASLALSFALNLPMAINLIPEEDAISEQPLLDPTVPVVTLLDVALVHRPELRQFELFLLSSQRNVQVAASPLYPTAGLFGMYTYDNTKSKPIGSGEGGTAGAGVFGGLFDTYQGGYSANWSLPNMALPTAFNVLSARALVRQSRMQANQELLLVNEQVRGSYLDTLLARAQIDNAAYGVVSGEEGLRLAKLRLRHGSGTNLDLITAQHNYIDALTTQAQAIVSSNIAQAQLMHDMGVITADALINGFKFTPAISKPNKVKP